MKLRFAPATNTFITLYAHSLPHALLLTGNEGVGLNTLAKYLASSNGSLLRIVSPESKTSTSLPIISVERVRQLYVETRSRLNGAHFVIIDDADAMNTTAQNALLKLLEEPNESIHFILTSHSSDKLLPTIRSRLQTFVVPPIDQLETKRLLTSLKVTDELDIQRLSYIAEGLPAELTRLAGNSKDFKLLAERVQKARQFVEGNTYQRLVLVQTLKDDRQATLKLIESIIMLLRRSLTRVPERQTVLLIERLLVASDAIRANGNIRLHLTGSVIQ